MATFYSTGYGGNYPERMTLRTVATINSQNIANNTSNVTISAYAYYNYGQYTAPNPTDGGQSLRIDDVRVHTGNENFSYVGTHSGNQIHLFSWTGDITHTADGSKTVELKVWQDCPGVTTLTALSGTHYWTLTTIPRASTPTVSAGSAAVGTPVTVNTNRVSSGFLHSFDYSIGGGPNIAIATGVADSFDWTLPAAIADALPNAASGTVTLTCYTWSGGTHIGTKTVTLTATIPNNATYKPDATLTSIAEATAAMAGVGVYLSGESTLRVQSSATPKAGASISQYKIEVAGGTYYGADITTGVISATGSQEVKLTVTDSRGFTNTHSLWVTFAVIAAPTVSAGSADLGTPVTITTNRAAAALTHTLTYAIGAESGTIATGVGASHPWTLPLTIGNALPNATSGTVTITQKTYNGANLLETRTVTMAATIPNSPTFQPDASIAPIAEGATGLAAFTVRIQGKSKLLITSTATPKSGATITQIKVDVDGGTYYATFTPGAGAKTASVTTEIIAAAGTVTATLTVTDSRGFTKTATLDTTVEPYAPPKINAFTANRSPNDQGEDLTALVDFTISPLANQNTKIYTLRYRPVGGSWTTPVGFTSTAFYTRSITHTAVGALDADLSHEVELTVSDSFGSGASKMIPIKTTFELINYRSTGKGIAFGKVSEYDGLEFGLPVYGGQQGIIGNVKTFENWGSFYAAASANTGAIIIALGAADMMVNAKITLRSYAFLAEIHVGGYTYTSTAGWHMPQATGTVHGGQLNVRFVSSGANRYIVIGETNTAWSGYLHVTVDKVAAGYFDNSAVAPYAVTLASTLPGTTDATIQVGAPASALSAYPVGSIYLSATATNPGSIFGGTWATFGTGRTLVGIDTGQAEFNTVEKTGGHKNLQSHAHTGSSGNAGAHGHTASSGAAGYHGHTGSAAAAGYHNHTQHGYWRFAPSTTGNFGRARLNIASDPADSDGNSAIDAAGSHTHPVTADAVGDHAHTVSVTGTGDHAHTVSVGSTGAGNAENLQPFITVYMWKRMA